MRTVRCSVFAVVMLIVIVMPTFAGESPNGPGPRALQAGRPDPPKSRPAGPKRGPDQEPAKSGPTPRNGSIGARIESRPQLAARLKPLLPAGMTLEQAATGFKNQGQFIAALHVSRNLNIPFDQLKTQMVTNGRSLGQSIQMLKPGTNAKTEAKRAETEAKRDLSEKSEKS